ncbi:permease prefix domain 1-containing protein [Microbacterium candidum]|uniref:Permease prefix domain 1-containing protein n=1 Tax=Microbacterium candidum TaxID=3041922 RepID=A0ABT7MU42_9MICO|nr:permease prefix domain 1-containing protein [Microbacterium sp. ASV49]MDL9977962.1 permease prefix domain 1-containing protein [Microbacterium sp. ASV49]
MNDPIDDYLDDLFDRLEGTPAERRRMLNETETHLLDSADAFRREGMAQRDAERAAVAAFGDAPVISQAENRRSPRAILVATVTAAAQLGLYGFAAIGLAALAARALAQLTSTQWVYGAPVGYSFPAARCAHWLAVQPTATDCSTAAALESSDDSFLFILSAAAIGLVVAAIVLGVARIARRGNTAAPRLPRAVVAAVGVTAFVGAGLALVVAAAADGMTRGIWGQGMLYADGVVALAFGILFLVRFLLSIRPVARATAW